MVQMALPFALSAAMPGIGGMFAAGGKLGGLGLGSMFSGMNPMAANALKQSMLGYGTAALTGAKKPGKAALYSGLASIPFSYMSAANAASAFNEANQGLTQPERFVSGTKQIKNPIFQPVDAQQGFGIPETISAPTYQFKQTPVNVPKITPMDILMGRSEKLAGIAPGTLDSYTSDSLVDTIPGEGYTRTKNIVEGGPKFRYSKIIPGKQMELPGADIYTKKPPLQEVYDPKT